MVKFFREFFPDAAIVESVKAAKDYLRSQFLQNKKKQAGPDATLTPQEIKTLENDPNFIEIKQMCVGTPSLTFTFTKFFFDDLSKLKPNERFDKLESILQNLDFLKSKKLKLPIPFEQYASLKKETGKGRLFRIEKLESDIKELQEGWYIKSFMNKLLTAQKAWFKDLSVDKKVEVLEVASKMMTLSPGIQNLFFKKVKRYKSYEDLIENAQTFLKSSGSSLFGKLAEVDSKFGEGQYVEIYDKDGILILEIKTYQANNIINSNTSHCIASRLSSWNDYVTTVTKQYYIYNLNLDPSDNYSVIGATMKADGTMTAAHLRDDRAIDRSRLEEVLEELGIDFDTYILPPTDEEVQLKIRIQKAKDLITEKGITLEQLKDCISLGADPNESYGIPLKFAILDDAPDRIEYLLSLGVFDEFYENDWNFAGYISSERSLQLLLGVIEKYNDYKLYLRILNECKLDLQKFADIFREKLKDADGNRIAEVLKNSQNLGSSMNILRPFLERMSNYQIIEILYFKEDEVLQDLLPYFENFSFDDFRNLLGKRFDKINIFQIAKPYIDKIELSNLSKVEIDKFLGSLSTRRMDQSTIYDYFTKFRDFIGPQATENFLCTFKEIPEGLDLDVFVETFEDLESDQIRRIVMDCSFLEDIKDEITKVFGNLYSDEIKSLIHNYEATNVELIMPELKEYIGGLTNFDIRSLLTECDSSDFFPLLKIVQEMYDELDNEDKIMILEYYSGSSERILRHVFSTLNLETITSDDIFRISDTEIRPNFFLPKLKDILNSFDSSDSYNLRRIVLNVVGAIDGDDWEYLPLQILDSDDTHRLLKRMSDNYNPHQWVMCSLAHKLSDDGLEDLISYNHNDSGFLEFRVGLIGELAKREGSIDFENERHFAIFRDYFENEDEIGDLIEALNYISKKGKENIIELMRRLYSYDTDLYNTISEEMVSNKFLTQEEMNDLTNELERE